MNDKCDHTYTLKSGKIFRCDARPHTSRPQEHYFVRDKAAEDRRDADRLRDVRTGSRLIVTPGDR